MIPDFDLSAVGRNRLLASLPAADLALIAQHVIDATLAKGSVLQEPGRTINAIYFPHSGLISLVGMLPEGYAVETASVGREGAVGLMAGLGAQSAFIRAVVRVPVRAARIPASRLAEAAAHSGPIRDMIVRYSEVLLAQVQQLVACNTLHHVPERLCRWLLNVRDRIGSDTLPFTQEFLADVLGVRRTTITMISRTLQAEGVIDVRRGRIQIRNSAALERKTCACYQLGRRLGENVVPPSCF